VRQSRAESYVANPDRAASGRSTHKSQSLARILTIVAVVAIPLLAWLLGPLWTGGEAPARFPASDALTTAFVEELCRPPDNAEILQWNTPPFEGDTALGLAPQKPRLLKALKATPEGQRVIQIRRIYFDVLARDASGGDCAELRQWVDRPVSMEEIAQRLSASPEARRVARVRQVFIETLGRDPSGWDNASLRREVDSGSTLGEIGARLAAQKPQVGVHYFMWYKPDKNRWGNGATVVRVGAPPPSLGWYTSNHTDVIDTHIRQMSGAGFDFAIVQIVTHSPASWENAHTFFHRLKGHQLKAAVMLDSLYFDTSAIKTTWVEKAKTEFTGYANYFSLRGEPLIMLFSARLDFSVPGAALRNVYWTNSYEQGTNTFNSDLFLYPADWPFWSGTPQPLINGVVPVVPGYVDTHLGRPEPMEYPRDNGRMYRAQWQRALALRPELIIVYSWNEHFEETAIEPTEAWGDRYLRWTACYIAHARKGTTGAC
jgi:hypothetical protein